MKSSKAVLIIFLTAFLPKLFLILNGGAYFWHDENRYNWSKYAIRSILDGQITQGLSSYFHEVIHIGFKFLATAPAFIEIITIESPYIPLIFFSIIASLSPCMVFFFMLRNGASQTQSTIGSFTLALTVSGSIYCRHILPYETSLTFVFIALLASTIKKDVLNHALVGVFSGLSFLIYFGYWYVIGFVLMYSTLHRSKNISQVLRNAFWIAFWFIIPITSTVLFSHLSHVNFFENLSRSTGMITQGSFEEGHLIVFLYLWECEGILSILWFISLFLTVIRLCRRKTSSLENFSLFGILFIFSSLVFFSNHLEKFVVYGRLVRQMTPFLCVLWGLWVTTIKIRTQTKLFLGITFLALHMYQWVEPLTLTFPIEFKSNVLSEHHPSENIKFLNTRSEITEVMKAQHHQDPKWSIPHPIQYKPYQYEGYDIEQRQALDHHPVFMQAVISEP